MFYLMLLLCFLMNPCFLVSASPLKKHNQYVSVNLSGQFGNQLFEIATAYAYALDNDLPLTIPDLVENKHFGIPHVAKTLFRSRIPTYHPVSSPLVNWSEPSFNYTPIPPSFSITLSGYFQSEKYFLHHRNEILDLFAAPDGLNEKILQEHPILASDHLVVGVQIRDYRQEHPLEQYHPTAKRDYYAKAVALFPEDTVFLVSSNNPKLAKECMEGLSNNIIYLKNQDYIEDFYTLVLCKSFIISNSSFGWWASWLCTEKDKIVITPYNWFSPPYDNTIMKKDLLPDNYLIM